MRNSSNGRSIPRSRTHGLVAEPRPRQPEAEDEPAVVAAPPASKPWGWISATVSALVALVVVAVLYWQSNSATQQAERAFEAVTASNEALTQAIEKWRIATEHSTNGVGEEGLRPMVLAIPFGEQALAPARLESVRALVAQLERAAISGVVRIETFSGSFCLESAGEQGYSLAPPASPAAQCEQVGNPVDETQGGTARQPLAFACATYL